MEDLKQKAGEERLNIDQRKKAIDIELSEVCVLVFMAGLPHGQETRKN